MSSRSPAQSISLPKRFYSLDVLRGFAALAVVVYHWHWFFSCIPAPTEPWTTIYHKMPFSAVLSPIYFHGDRAVDLFFCLSGFIFCWLYARPIRDKKISLFSFGVLRISRLYPLHLATLVFLAVAEYFFRAHTGNYFISTKNSPGWFIRNLFMVQAWTFGPGYSFNGPTWSVSVEVLLYTVFFILCALGCKRWWHWTGLLAVSLLLGLRHMLPDVVIRGLSGFFVGCITFLLISELIRRQVSRRFVAAVVIATILLWVGATLPHTTPVQLREGHVATEGSATKMLDNLIRLYYVLLVFPATILSLALVESARGTLGKRLAIIGDLSYSTYLLQFPLSMVVWMIFLSAHVSRDVFYSPLLLVSYFTVLISISLLEFRFFEKPAQVFIRMAILGKASRGKEAEPKTHPERELVSSAESLS